MQGLARVVWGLALLTFAGGLAATGGQNPEEPETPLATAKRLQGKEWWPTRTDSARKDYAGTAACLPCHRQEVESQQETPMAHAASRAEATAILRDHPALTRDDPPFRTLIQRDKKGSTYVVSRGGEAMSGQVTWTMGQGAMGQTFLLDSGGTIYESQLSYYEAIGGLDLTPGHAPAGPKDLLHAFGEPQSEVIAQKCFGCHTTASSVKRQFDPAHATPGVTCEACHGPGAQHIAAMQQGHGEGKVAGRDSILDPGSFGPVKMVDYCGACHRAPLDIANEKELSAIDVRFQPYRLAKSRCWSKPDARIACVACHNPHLPLERSAAAYDRACLACHALRARQGESHPAATEAAARREKPCPVASDRCVTCHMPRYAIKQLHGSFTDHDIRIVRPNDPYPL